VPVTAWLDEEEMKAWRGLVEVYVDVFGDLDAELQRAHGLAESEYGVLVVLSEAPDHRLRMCDLAGALHLSPSGLTRRLDGLAAKGWVRREPSPNDRRVTFAALTPKGMAKLEAAAPQHVEGVRRNLLGHLTRTQIRQLGAILESVRQKRAAQKE
jgi:DNA-binding MarR family transcriptional regulator